MRSFSVRMWLCRMMVLIAATAGLASAGTVNVGYIALEFDNPVDGIKTFTFYNLTGNAFGCTADFPVCTDLTLSGVLQVSVDSPFGPTNVNLNLDPMGPGVASPSSFSFTSTAVLLSAVFNGTVAPLLAQVLNDGERTLSPNVQAADVMSSQSLIALITAEIPDTVPVPIPEPGTLGLGALALALIGRAVRAGRN